MNLSGYRLWYAHDNSDSKVHGANMGPTWGRQDPGGSPVGPMNLAILEYTFLLHKQKYIQLNYKQNKHKYIKP